MSSTEARPSARPSAAAPAVASPKDLPGGVDKRRHERIPVQAPVEIQADVGAQRAELRDISLSGAFIATTPATLSQGAGLRVEFTLPQGFRVNAFGRIAWSRDREDAQGPAGYGIQFYGLDDVNREFIQYYLELAQRGERGPIGGGRIETRFEVSERAENQLYVRMTGSLIPLEADSLEEVVCRKLARMRRGQLLVYIDARDLGACPKASLDHVRAWLERLRFNHQVLGVMLGGSSIGVVQVRRLAREAGIADSLIMFTDKEEAEEFWRTLVANAAGAAA